jgi:hypothetical protein
VRPTASARPTMRAETPSTPARTTPSCKLLLAKDGGAVTASMGRVA